MRTARQSKALPPQLAPRLIDRDAAAAYVGLPVITFKAIVNVTPLQIGNRALYDVADLNTWIDRQKGSRQTREEIMAKLAG